MKRILFLLSFCLFFTANMQAETVIIDELNYILDEEAKTASVTWTLDHLSGNIVIPDNVSYSGVTYSVTSIGDHAFDYFYRFFVNIPEGEEEIWFEDFRMAGTGITGIVIPESVTSIGRSAFASCSDLTSINIPKSITSVGECAFGGCYSLREFSGNSSFISSDRRCLIIDGTPVAFAQSGLSSYNIPNGVTKIGRNAFNDCRGLTGIIIPDGVTSIEEQAFKDCTNLTSITIPSSVTSIGNSAFSDCTSLTGITVPEGVTVIEDGTFNNCNRLTDIVLPESVTSIGRSAFALCSGLTSINIPGSVTSVGDSAFMDCYSLKGFSGSSSIISSDRRCLIVDGTLVAFAQGGLSSYNIPNGVTKIGSNAFNDCSGLTGIITIPEGVTSIEERAFSFCRNLTGITIPSSVTSIGNSAFSDCTSLTGITVPEGVTVIEDGTFNNCNRLTDIVLPESVTTIGWAFIACRNLTSINIPKGVRQINTQAFDSCWRLQDVFCYAKAVPNGVNKITADCSPIFKATLHVPASAIDKYKTTYPWNQFGKIIPMTRKGLHPVSQVRTLL